MGKTKEPNATCAICGKKYHLCIHCDKTKDNWKSWKVIVDDSNCYEIFKVLNDYNFKKITKLEARKLLKELDLSEKNTFKESVRNQIDEIMAAKKKKVVEEPVEEIAAIAEPVIGEVSVVENISMDV